MTERYQLAKGAASVAVVEVKARAKEVFGETLENDYQAASKVAMVVKCLHSGKAAGVDEIPPEMLKSLHNVEVSWLMHLFNVARKDGSTPLSREARPYELLPGRMHGPAWLMGIFCSTSWGFCGVRALRKDNTALKKKKTLPPKYLKQNWKNITLFQFSRKSPTHMCSDTSFGDMLGASGNSFLIVNCLRVVTASQLQKQAVEICLLSLGRNSEMLKAVDDIMDQEDSTSQSWDINDIKLPQSKGAHDHPRPETKLEAEARRSIQKAHTAVSPTSPRLKRCREAESLTGEMQSQEALPLLLSNQENYISPCSFNGHLIDKNPQEQIINNCLSLAKNYGFGRSPYLTEHSQDTGSNKYYEKCKEIGSREHGSGDLSGPSVCNMYADYGEPQPWNKNTALERNPCTDKCCNGSALSSADLHCEIVSSQNCMDSSIQHVPNIPPTTKAGYHPARPNTGLSGDDFYEGKWHVNYNSSYIPSSFYHLSSEDPYLIMNSAHHHQQPLPLTKGNEWDFEEERKYTNLDYCNNELFFSLCPLR
ncbi:unnamed protein product [Caretta caretta]